MSKFKIGDHVRVTALTTYWFDRTGVVAEIEPASEYPVFMDLDNGGQVAFTEHELILADVVDANNRAFVDGLAAQREMQNKINYSIHKAARASGVIDDSPEIAPTISDADRLRLIADVVNGQTPFGTELANFRRRLLAVLSIGGQS